MKIYQAVLLVRRLNSQLEARPELRVLIDETDLDEPAAAVKIPKPTDAYPGSLAKVEILCARAAAGELLWHPDDARTSEATILPLTLDP
jgi:hypothetical protein